MSQSDKTRQKLVDSMRKTKSGSTGKNDAVEADEPKTAPSRPPETASTVKTKPAPKRSEKKPVVSNAVDGYQSARRRVWPD